MTRACPKGPVARVTNAPRSVERPPRPATGTQVPCGRASGRADERAVPPATIPIPRACLRYAARTPCGWPRLGVAGPCKRPRAAHGMKPGHGLRSTIELGSRSRVCQRPTADAFRRERRGALLPCDRAPRKRGRSRPGARPCRRLRLGQRVQPRGTPRDVGRRAFGLRQRPRDASTPDDPPSGERSVARPGAVNDRPARLSSPGRATGCAVSSMERGARRAERCPARGLEIL